MRLYTFQPPEILDIINQDGIYYAQYDKCPDDWLKDRYKFMEEQVKTVRPNMPIWAWQNYDYKHGVRKKPTFSKHNKECYLYTLIVPDDIVVLSNLCAWEQVLNDNPIPSKMEDWDIEYEIYENLPKNHHLCLDLKHCEIIFGCKHVQACIPYIKKEFITKVEKYNDKLRIKQTVFI